MNRERILGLSAQAGLVAVINGKRDAFYAPPENIYSFAKMIMEECAKVAEKLPDSVAVQIASEIREMM